MLKRLALSSLAALPLISTQVAAEEVKIGFTAALSGDFAAFGLNIRKGLEIALTELNQTSDTTFSLTSADDRGEAREGVLIAQRFCSDESIDVVMGYSFSSIALAAVPVFDRCKLPVLASAVTSPDLTGASAYFRRNVMTDATQGQTMGRYATEKLGFKRVYILNQQDDYGIGLSSAFSDAAAKNAEIVGQESYLLGTKDFKTLLIKARAAKPDAIFIGGFYSEAAKIAEQARALGIKVQLLGSDGSLNPDLISLGRSAVEGMIAYGMFDPSVSTETTASFIDAYQSAYGEQPNAWAALGYDAGKTLAAAVTQAKSQGALTRESLNEAFSTIKDIPGVTGPTTFEASGDRVGSLYFLQVKDGAFRLADTQ